MRFNNVIDISFGNNLLTIHWSVGFVVTRCFRTIVASRVYSEPSWSRISSNDIFFCSFLFAMICDHDRVFFSSFHQPQIIHGHEEPWESQRREETAERTKSEEEEELTSRTTRETRPIYLNGEKETCYIKINGLFIINSNIMLTAESMNRFLYI